MNLTGRRGSNLASHFCGRTLSWECTNMMTKPLKNGCCTPRLLALGAFLLLGQSQAGVSAGPAEPGPASVPAAVPARPSDDDLRRSDWIAAGRAKFISACSYCHGSKGDAGKVKSFTERENWDPQFIHDTIVNGRTRGANVMPPWGGSIADEEIWRIVSYIKSLSKDFKGPIQADAPK